MQKKSEFSKEFFLKKWFPFGTLIFWSLMMVSYLFYPTEGYFSIMTHSISFLGDWYDNPFPGWLFFTLALTVGGIFFMPIGLYIYRRMRVVCKPMAVFLFFLFLLGCLGVIGTGIFADTREVTWLGVEISEYHNTTAVIGFGGVLLAALGYQLFPLKDRIEGLGGKNFLDYRKLRIPNFVLWIFILGMAISQALRGVYGYNSFPGPGLYSFTFWEWMLLGGIWIYHWLMVVYLPEDYPKQE